MARKIGGQFYVAARRHDWRPGEKSLFARRNDLRSITATLRVARARTVVDPEEIERLEELHEQMVARLRSVEREFGFEPEQVLDADRVIAEDRDRIQDHIFGTSVAALSKSLSAAKRQRGVTYEDESGRRVPRYPNAAAEVERLQDLIMHSLGDAPGANTEE